MVIIFHQTQKCSHPFDSLKSYVFSFLVRFINISLVLINKIGVFLAKNLHEPLIRLYLLSFTKAKRI